MWSRKHQTVLPSVTTPAKVPRIWFGASGPNARKAATTMSAAAGDEGGKPAAVIVF